MRRLLPFVISITACGGDPAAPGAPDATPPPPSETEITEGPAEITASRSVTFVFTSTVAGATFRCRLDAAPFAPCAPPLILTVDEGSHVFQALAAGDDSPAEHAFRVNVTPPETLLTARPEADMAMSEAVFAFTSSEADSGFECALDGAAPAPCTSPQSFATLALGRHSFSVRASDPAVNTDPSPATWEWTVSAVTPETRVVRGPHSPWRETGVDFEFSADVAGARFECQLDDEARQPCVSPAAYADLAEGAHRFQVWGIDASGRADPSPAVHEFAIVFVYW